MRVVLWVMVVLGLPCAAALWVDLCLGPLRRRVARRRVGSGPHRESTEWRSGEAAPPRPYPPRGGERR